MTTTLDEVTEYDTVVMTRKDDIMHRDDDDKRLTPTQKEIRARCEQLPKRLRRSIDQFRASVGMVPLWSSSPQQQRQRHG